MSSDDCYGFEYCKSFYCLLDECEAGQMWCDGNTVATCSEDGDGTEILEECADTQYCEFAECHEQICSPGLTWCVGMVLKTCDDIGKELVKEEDCAAQDLYCLGEECIDVVCEPSVPFCEDDFTKATCAADGQSYETFSCPAGHFCEGGACFACVCTPLNKWCNGFTAFACNAKGSEETQTDCLAAGKVCKDGECVDSVCPPGEPFCLDAVTPALCHENGLGYDSGACQQGMYCMKGDCLAVACPPDQKYCEGPIAQKCDAVGSGPLPGGEDCAAKEWLCWKGECVSCIPDCGGKVCGDDGCGGSCGACKLNEECTAGKCGCPGVQCNGGCCKAGAVCLAQGCCQPGCQGKECGSDGCDGTCGTCGVNENCVSGQCECPNVECAGICCQGGAVCHLQKCCVPACGGKSCGSDGCGGSCGQCAEGAACINGKCPPPGKECDDGNAIPWDGCTGNKFSEFKVVEAGVPGVGAPVVATFGDGGYAVAWHGTEGGSSSSEIRAVRYTTDGTTAWGPILVNTYTLASQTSPCVASFADGRLLVGWDSYGQDGAEKGVYGQIISKDGAKVGSEFPVNSYTAGDQKDAACIALVSGEFLVAWSGEGAGDNSGGGIYAQRFDAAGKKAGGEMLVNTYVLYAQTGPELSMSGAGYVSVWESIIQDGASGGVYGQRFGSDGKAAGTEFLVNATTANNQRAPTVSGGSQGFVVAWESNLQDGAGWGVFGRLFGADASPLGAEFQVNKVSTGDQAAPSASFCGSGGGEFAVAWQGQEGGKGIDIFVQRFAKGGTKNGEPIKVNLLDDGDQTEPYIASFGNCGFAVAWLQAASGATTIFVQRFDSAGKRVYH